MNFWKGKSIRLRAIEPSDAKYFMRWNLDSERARNLDFVWPPQSEAAVKAWVEEQAHHKLEGDTFTWIVEAGKGQPVGVIVTYHCNHHDGTFSYSIDIAAGQRRKGYATEAILIILRYYFDELRYRKVTVPVHSDNDASIRLHEKLGFQFEGTFRHMFFTHGHHVDVLWFGMLDEEFHQLHP